jgi:hypothetical protein
MALAFWRDVRGWAQIACPFLARANIETRLLDPGPTCSAKVGQTTPSDPANPISLQSIDELTS